MLCKRIDFTCNFVGEVLSPSLSRSYIFLGNYNKLFLHMPLYCYPCTKRGLHLANLSCGQREVKRRLTHADIHGLDIGIVNGICCSSRQKPHKRKPYIMLLWLSLSKWSYPLTCLWVYGSFLFLLCSKAFPSLLERISLKESLEMRLMQILFRPSTGFLVQSWCCIKKFSYGVFFSKHKIWIILV